AAPPVPAPPADAPRPWAQPATPSDAPAAPDARPAPTSPAPRDPVAVASARRAEPPPTRRAPAGAPDVRLSFLLFSPSPQRRSVALAINGGSLETLHEGEST